MRIVVFCHSLLSDWNHGNAHFLRGVTSELLASGHDVRVYEPRDAWSLHHLLAEAGPAAVDGFRRAYPQLAPIQYDPGALDDLDEAMDRADLVLVHEWNPPALVAAIGRHRARSGRYVLLFHDTHHRSVSDPASLAACDLQHYDGVLAFGEVIRERYVREGWSRRAFTWHEAADVRVFSPRNEHGEGDALRDVDGDLVWIGNWGDGERSQETAEYLLRPVTALRLRCRVHGVRYPVEARHALAAAGVEYAGWLANYRVPDVFARFLATIHIPRRPYVEAMPGIPTIRVFEALACGIPLVSSWWDDAEGLFRPGRDFLMTRTPAEMQDRLREVTADPSLRASLAASGRETILARHTCAHRAAELFAIARSISPGIGERSCMAEPRGGELPA